MVGLTETPERRKPEIVREGREAKRTNVQILRRRLLAEWGVTSL